MRKLTLIVLAASLAAAASWCDTKDTTRFNFLLIEPGVRPGGFGKAFTGLADDVNASFYNPGGLALQEKNGISVMHEPRGTGELKDMFYDYVAFSYGMGKYGRLSADIIYNDAGKMDATDTTGRVYGVIHSYMAAPSLYWSYPVRADLGVGAGVTYAYEHLTDQPGGVDQQILFNGGVLYKTPLKGLSGGLAFTNVGTNKTGTRRDKEKREIEVSWPPPRAVRLGLGYRLLSNELNDLTFAADASKLLMNFKEHLDDELGQAVYSGGAEYVYAKMVAVRAGYYRDKWGVITGLTLGFGFAYKGISFDYARVPEGQLFKDRHRFAVGYVF
ncbi:MAG: PorV/PorQ family protein [candidate division Zixibacteria bacterium]|nr:PorV/PorQ family protein [candidate division Zixibacteria bacterium]